MSPSRVMLVLFLALVPSLSSKLKSKLCCARTGTASAITKNVVFMFPPQLFSSASVRAALYVLSGMPQFGPRDIQRRDQLSRRCHRFSLLLPIVALIDGRRDC